MSFASETKNELALIMPEKKCCMIAEIAAFIRVCGKLRLMGGGKFEIAVTTENAAVARHFNRLIKEYFNIETNVEISAGGNLSKSGHSYMITISPENLSEQILRETGILMVREGMNFISDGIYDGLVRTKCCRKSYVRALFLATGTMTDPKKDYHFEVKCQTKLLANDIKKLINTFTDITAKSFERRKEQVVYVNGGEAVLDLLAIMGAQSQYFAFENVRMQKELKNEANRLANCDQANIDKTLNAAGRMIEIIDEIGIENMPPKLAEVAVVRKENPDLSLKDLGEKMDPPMTKAGVNSRLKRIEALAKKMGKL